MSVEEDKRELSDIIRSQKIASREVMPAFRTEILMCALREDPVYLYGAGKDIDVFIQYLKTAGVMPKGIVDADPEKAGVIIEGITIISPDIFRKLAHEHSFVFVYSFIRSRSEETAIYSLMLECGIQRFFVLGDLRYDLCGFLPQHAVYYEGRREFYKMHETDLGFLLERLYDDISRKTLLEYIRSFKECDTYRYLELDTEDKYFYDYGGKGIYSHLENEVWLNCGAESGGTIAEFLRNGLSASKIFAVEPVAESIRQLKVNIKSFSCSADVEIINLAVDGSGSLKKRVLAAGEKITLINADIEGAELDLLKEMSEIIQRDRPVVALCVYHKKEDLIDIPRYIDMITNEYSFVLRKYAGWLRGDSRRCLELVLYAVPNERMTDNLPAKKKSGENG